MTKRTRDRLLSALLIGAVLLFPLLHDNDADIDAAANAAAFAVLALGLNIVVGFAGLLDLGYAAFFAIGAYLYGALTSFQILPHWAPFWEPFAALGLVARLPNDLVHFTVSFWLALPLAALVAAGCGVAFGAPTLRLRGDYLAIVTLGFGEIVPIVARNLPAVTNGAAGLNGIAPPSVLGHSFGVAATPYYYVAVGMVLLLMLVSVRLRDSRIGRAWMAIREDETAASAMGIDRVRFKLLAFATGAAFAGMAGTFYVAKLQTATPEMFGFPVSVMVLVMIVLGGLGSVRGVVLGAVLLSLLQSWWLADLTEWLHALGGALAIPLLTRIELAPATELIFGIVLVVMMLFRRDGLVPATGRQAAMSFERQHAEVERRSPPPQVPRAATEAPPVLSVNAVGVRFGGLVALRDVSFAVPEGGVLAIVGPNGSGKSTLFNVMTGLVPASAGSVVLTPRDAPPRDLTRLKPHRILRAGIARTFQNIRLFPDLTVLQNVLIGEHARLRSGPIRAVLRLPATRAEERAARDRAIAILSLFANRLLPRLDQPVRALSYANRRRVEIARALASRPRVLLLDEPTAGMNPAETLELADQIAALNANGLTIVLIEHKLDVVAQLADSVVVLDGGEVIARGTPDAVRRDPQVIAAYLGRDLQAGHAANVA